jgi:hypothetical protein
MQPLAGAPRRKPLARPVYPAEGRVAADMLIEAEPGLVAPWLGQVAQTPGLEGHVVRSVVMAGRGWRGSGASGTTLACGDFVG